MKYHTPFISTILITAGINTFAQSEGTNITGTIANSNNQPLTEVFVSIENSNLNTQTDSNGNFKLTIPENGTYNLNIGENGYEEFVTTITTDQPLIDLNKIILKESSNKHKEVHINGVSGIQKVRESSYNVVAIDASKYYNTTTDLAHLLNKVSGVRIRENGGVGSDMSISLNGFTGRYVKVFMDGVPMQGYGSSFQLNNIPVNVAERIEVYKGVIPIEFGTDALGGAINIVTKKNRHSFVDASYSFGSFNTHKTNLSLGYTSKKGFTAQLSAFQNFSDNSYKVYSQILNLNTGQYSVDSQWAKRFHDNYHNETVIGKIGFVRQKWADRALIGMTLSQEYADIQNANLMKIVYGKRFRKAHNFSPSIEYAKRNFLTKGLNVSLNGNYNSNWNQNVDTAARQYNWLGEYRIKNSKGEGENTMAEFTNKNASLTVNATYHLGKQHTFSVNNLFSDYRRKANNAALISASSSDASDSMKRRNFKNVLGASYKFDYNQKWSTTFFSKFYSQRVTGPVDTTTTTTSKYALKSMNYSINGYGAASSYFINDYLQVKASIEKAFRLPTETELFGDEVLETGNSTLRAEKSWNYNFGFTINKILQEKHGIYVDISFMYRNISDYIFRSIEQRYGNAIYTNFGHVKNLGINGELRYSYKDLFNIGGTMTLQNIRNREKYISATSNQLSSIYGDRMPNVPYMFGGLNGTLFLKNLLGNGNNLSINYDFTYIHEFYFGWESLGSTANKITIPKQYQHDLTITYAIKNGRYNVTLQGNNLLNARLYDNFSLQKPGRSLAVMLRYYFMK